MGEMIPYKGSGLPASIGDLSRFILIGREKLVSVKAEIRAIDKLHIAEEVRNQKKEEAMMLSEALLDAEVRLGELTKDIPKQNGKRTDLTSLPQGNEVNHGETKEKHIQKLGFNKKQVFQFESMAKNPESVAQAKAEAREKDEPVTRSKVLDVIAVRKRRDESYYQKLDLGVSVYNELSKINSLIRSFELSDERIEALLENYDENLSLDDEIDYINYSINTLQNLKMLMRKGEKPCKKVNRYGSF